jgi:hypothetical protein
MYGRSARPWHHDAVLFALDLPDLIAAIAPALAVPVAALLAKSSVAGSQRAALLITFLAGALVVGTSQAARWHVAPVALDMFYSSSTSVRAGDQNRPLWEVQRKFAAQREALHARDPRARDRWERNRGTRPFTVIDRHEVASRILLIVPLALLGIGWAKSRRWMTGVLGGLALLTIVPIQTVTYLLSPPDPVARTLAILWASPIVLTLVSLLALAVRTTRQRSCRI